MHSSTNRRLVAINLLRNLAPSLVLYLFAFALALTRPLVSEDPIVSGVISRWFPFAVLLYGCVSVIRTLLSMAPADAQAHPRVHPQAWIAACVAVAFIATPQDAGLRVGTLYFAFVLLAGGSGMIGFGSRIGLGSRRVALLTALFALAMFLSIDSLHRALQPTQSDEPHYLLITQSL